MDSLPHLAPRERQVLLLVAEEGLSHKEIADRLSIADGSVKRIVSAVGKRLGLAPYQPQLHMTIWYWKRKLQSEGKFQT